MDNQCCGRWLAAAAASDADESGAGSRDADTRTPGIVLPRPARDEWVVKEKWANRHSRTKLLMLTDPLFFGTLALDIFFPGRYALRCLLPSTSRPTAVVGKLRADIGTVVPVTLGIANDYPGDTLSIFCTRGGAWPLFRTSWRRPPLRPAGSVQLPHTH